MKLVFIFLATFCAVQCFGASIANNEESNKTYEDNQIACVLKALNEAKTSVKEGKEQCNKDKKCLIKLAIRVTVNLWNDLKKCRNNMVFVLGEPRINDDEIWKLLDDIINKFGDQLPQDIKDLLEDLKKILNGDSGEDKTDCDKQRRHDSELLSKLLVNQTKECMVTAPDMERCLKGVLFEFAEEQQNINDQYQECMGPNEKSEATVFSEEIWKLIDDIINKYGDQLPQGIKDLLEKLKKIVHGDSSENKTDCDKQRRHDSGKLSDFLMIETKDCVYGPDMEECIKSVLLLFAKEQKDIDEQYQKCMRPNEESKSTVASDNRIHREYMAKAVFKAWRSWKEGKGKCHNRDCIKQLVSQIGSDLKQDIKNCRDNIVFVFGVAQITDEDILSVMDNISNMFGDLPPKEISHLIDEFLNILYADSEERKNECYQQKRYGMFKLGQEVIDEIPKCGWEEKCVAEHMVIYSKLQQKIEEEYEACVKKNL